jgi:hypothetical protein
MTLLPTWWLARSIEIDKSGTHDPHEITARVAKEFGVPE